MTQRFAVIVERVKRWHAYRAWQRFGDARGNLLAAGIAYFAFFSLFPAFALAAVVFGFVLQGRPDLLESIGASLNQALPGFVRTADNPDGLIQLAAPETATLSWAGAVAFVTLVVGGLGWIGSLREGIRAVFGVTGSAGNVVLAKLRDLAVLALFGVAVVVSAGLTSVAGAAATWLATLLGLADVSWVLAVAGVLVSLLVDTAIMVLLLRVLSGVPLPWRDVRGGAVIGGVGMTVLKLVGAQLVARATASPLFGSIVVVVGLLFWLNLISRLVLLSAAWAADDIDVALAAVQARHQRIRPAGPDTSIGGQSAGAAGVGGVARGAGAGPVERGAADPAEHRGWVDATDPRARARAGLPDLSGVSQRDKDRVGVAAGVVVGLGVAAVVGAAARSARALVAVARPGARLPAGE
jgi:membrane protein